MRLIDSHAHLDFRQFDRDRDAVILRAREAGLVAIVNIGANLASSRASVALAEQYDFIYATVGIHPHDAKTVNQDVLGMGLDLPEPHEVSKEGLPLEAEVRAPSWGRKAELKRKEDSGGLKSRSRTL